MKKKLKILPKFKNEDDERKFWDTHDSTEYIDWSKARHVTFPNLKLTKWSTSYVVKVIEFKGQLCVPIPKPLMKQLGWKEGDEIIVDYDKAKKVVTMRKK